MKEKVKKQPKAPKAPKQKKAKKEKVKLPKSKFSESLAFKLEISIFFLLAFFFTILVFVLNTTISRDNIRSYTDLFSALSERSSTALNYWLNGYFKDLRVFTKNEVFLEGDIQLIREYILENQTLIGDDFDYVGICGLDGVLYTSNNEKLNARRQTISLTLSKTATEAASRIQKNSVRMRVFSSVSRFQPSIKTAACSACSWVPSILTTFRQKSPKSMWVSMALPLFLTEMEPQSPIPTNHS